MTICFVHKNKFYADTTISMGAYVTDGLPKIYHGVLDLDGVQVNRTIALAGEMYLAHSMVRYWLGTRGEPTPLPPTEGYAELIIADSVAGKPTSLGLVVSQDPSVLVNYPLNSSLVIGREVESLATRALLEAGVDPEKIVSILDAVSIYKFRNGHSVPWCDANAWEEMNRAGEGYYEQPA